MKKLIILATAATIATAGIAFAQQTTTTAPTSKAACEAAKMKWDDKGGKDGKGACMAAAPATGTKPADAKK